MDFLKRLDELLAQKGWSTYQLAKASGLTQSTISAWYKKNYQPNIQSLEAICKGLGLSISEFFADGSTPNSLTEEQLAMFERWSTLSSEQKALILKLIENMK
ncbi:helix-turn-helix domain-containing protein [Zongyangia hominis]|uniref:Helix-turn-helix transcriptional regulator n=1 Tax=Zongyangia hominis TaxID=2763677 RepID=A0A926ECM6_9FIRM|nr:helix-turn-helix transcriptional regulator [Zongyangia hominis]MBC8571447.1 helix-turn-helix transcriptional regulator [Zongyangia hominis]